MSSINNNLTLAKATLRGELLHLFAERDRLVKQNNKTFTKLKEFDNFIYNTILTSRNTFLDLIKDQKFDKIQPISYDKVEKSIDTRKIIIQDIKKEILELVNIIKTINEFKTNFIKEVKTLIQGHDKTKSNEELNIAAQDEFDKTFKDIITPRTPKDLNKINETFKKRNPSRSPTKSPRSPTKSPRSPTKSPTKKPSKSQSKKVRF